MRWHLGHISFFCGREETISVGRQAHWMVREERDTSPILPMNYVNSLGVDDAGSCTDEL